MNGSIVFSLFFVLFFSYGVVASLDFVPLARIFPLSVSCVALGLALINLVQDLWRQKRHLDQDSGMGLSDLESDWDIPHAEVWKRASFFIGLFGALYLGIWVVGFPLAMSLFVMLFYRRLARAPLARVHPGRGILAWLPGPGGQTDERGLARRPVVVGCGIALAVGVRGPITRRQSAVRACRPVYRRVFKAA